MKSVKPSSIALLPLVLWLILSTSFHPDVLAGSPRGDSSRKPSKSFREPRLTIGRVLTSLDSIKTRFGTKDLIYIKIEQSSGHINQVGDRYGIESEDNLPGGMIQLGQGSGRGSSTVGEVEIISVCEETLLGIILKANGSIFTGESVCCLERSSVPTYESFAQSN